MHPNDATASANPYASPAAPTAVPPPRPQYRSRTQAFLAESWRGAKLGGKWMAMILIAMTLFAWTSMLVVFLYFWLLRGADFWDVVTLLDPVDMLLRTLPAIAAPTLAAAVLSGLIVGLVGAIAFRRRP